MKQKENGKREEGHKQKRKENRKKGYLGVKRNWGDRNGIIQEKHRT